MTRREELHGEALKRQVIIFDEIVEFIRQRCPNLSRKAIHSSYVKPLVNQGKLKRIRRGLFLGVPLEVLGGEPHGFDKLLVASKTKDEAVLAYHSALEVFGCAENAFDEVFVGVKSFFTPFRLANFEFRPVLLPKFDLDIIEVLLDHNRRLQVTSKERTFLDCLNHPEYAGGWEECLKSLEAMNGLNFERMFKLLDPYSPCQRLLRKVGFVLELFQESSIYYQDLSEDDLSNIQKSLSRSRLYLNKAHKNVETTFNSRWQLYVPVDFEEYLRGV